LKYFPKVALFCALTILGAKAFLLRAALSSWAENVVGASSLESALFRAMTLPDGPVLAPRLPSEARGEVTALIQKSPRQGDLYALRAQQEERQLDFAAAELDWKQAVTFSTNKAAAWLNLADFYHRRIRYNSEVEALLPAQAFPRALDVYTEANLPSATRDRIYEAWIAHDPKQTEPYLGLFHALVKDKNRQAAGDLAARIKAAFPDNLRLNIQVDSEFAGIDQGNNAALAVYSARFTPLWPADVRDSYFQLLSGAHQLRAFLADAHAKAAADPAALDPALRLFFYYEQQQKRELADQQLLEFETRRTAAKTAWSAADLKMLGPLFERVADYDESARSYYLLYELPSAARSDKDLALGALISLLLDVPEQPLQFGARDLSLYQNIGTMDRHPGFLNGIASLVLNTTFPQFEYQTASQTAIAYFHRELASSLIERLRQESPNAAQIPALEAKLVAAYAAYGKNDAITRLVPPWLEHNAKSPDYTSTALLLADAYFQTKRTTEEFALYDKLLVKLGDESGHLPFGESDTAVRSADYARVLDRYISRLTELKRFTGVVALYRKEIDRNPNDPGIYERLALYVEQNHFDADLETTYRAAMKQFPGVTWTQKLARFYLRRQQNAAYLDLTHQLTGTFDGSTLATFLTSVSPDRTLNPTLYRQINLYAHERFPHNLTFIRNLLTAYRAKGSADPAAYTKLLRENWFYDAGLRTEFFEELSQTGKLKSTLAALPSATTSAQQKNPAALQFLAEGHAWLAEYEDAAPAFVQLAELDPGSGDWNDRAISVERSLAPSVTGAFDTATRLARRNALAELGNAAALTRVGEIYADKENYRRAAPWWNRLVSSRPGSPAAYLDSATVFWDYFQFNDALRIVDDGRRTLKQPALLAYQAGVIHENKNEYGAAIGEYLKAALVMPRNGDDGDLAQRRLLQLASRKATAAEVEKRTAALVDGPTFDQANFDLRVAILEKLNQKAEIRTLLDVELPKISDVQQVDVIRPVAQRYGFDDVSEHAFERIIALTSDPVEKLQARINLGGFYEAHKDLPRAEREFTALLTENPNLLGVIRANVDFYWNQKQPKKAVATLEAAVSRAEAPFRGQLQREAAQKAADSSDFVEARRLLDDLLKTDPYNGNLLAAKASTYAREGNHQALTDFYAGELTQLQAAPLPAAEKTTRVAALRRGYIDALIVVKHFDQALQQYEAVLNVYPEDAALAATAARFAETNQLDSKLRAYYQKATADSPRDYRWPLLLGRLETTLRLLPDAIAAFEKAAYVRPDRSDIFLAKADLEIRLQRFDAALKTYQKLYDLSYHDSQYLVAQAELQARLGNKDESVRLLRAAYSDANPQSFGGFVSVMSNLSSWHMYEQVDQVYQQAQALISNDSDYMTAVNLEVGALAGMHRPFDALDAVDRVWQKTKVDGKGWSTAPQVSDIGKAVAAYLTPEEKLAFAKRLLAPGSVAAEFNIYDLARTSELADVTASRLYQSARSRPQQVWASLNQYQSSRLQYEELGHQLETIANAMKPDPVRDQVAAAAVSAYDKAGDPTSELRLADFKTSRGTPAVSAPRYAALLTASGGDPAARIRELSGTDPNFANALVQWSIAHGPAPLALQAVQARGGTISGLWTNSYTALTGLYYLNPQAARAFDAVLGPRTVGAQLTRQQNDSLKGNDWFYYAARYGDYLINRQQADADGMLLANLEAAPNASNSYVRLGDTYRGLGQGPRATQQYEQALELSPTSADVLDRLAMAEHKDQQARAIVHWRAAFDALAKRAAQGQPPPEYYETAKTILTHVNEAGLERDLRPDAEAMLRAYIARNGGYNFIPFFEGILDGASDRKAALEWIITLTNTPETQSVLDELIQSNVVTSTEKELLYKAEIARAQTALQGAGNEQLQLLRIQYVQYLASEKRHVDAWQALIAIDPPASRPPDMLLKIGALSGHLNEILQSYATQPDTRPTSEQILSIAGELNVQGYKDLARQMEEYEYTRELQGDSPPASAYLGLARIRLEQKRNQQALVLIQNVTLAVGAPFENLLAATTLLEEMGLKTEALVYAKQWRSAEPWNVDAQFAEARIASDKALLDAVRTSPRTPYDVRAKAATALRDLGEAAPGAQELDLLTHATISPEEAAQPYFVLARLEAAKASTTPSTKVKLYAEAIAIQSSLQKEALALAEAAFDANKDALGLAAFAKYHGPGPQLSRIQELAAAVHTKHREFDAAVALYEQALNFTTDPEARARLEKLLAAAREELRVERANQARQPRVTQEVAQEMTVKPRLPRPKGSAE
jgi:cellulose synthase operon protein C